MYIFTRRVLVNPSHLRKAMAHALEMTRFVNDKTGLRISLFQMLQGEPQGTLVFGHRTESYAATLDAVDPLLVSDEYLDRVEQGAQYFQGSPEDRLGEVIHMTHEVSEPPAVASTITAQMDPIQAARAIGWSVKIADYTANLSGLPMAVVTSNYGPYGTLSWMTYAGSVAEVEESGKKINSDPGFLQQLGDSTGLFIPGSGHGTLARRIA